MSTDATGGASPDTPTSGGANPDQPTSEGVISDQPGEPRDADQELLGIRKALSASRLEAKQRKADLDKAAAEIHLLKQQMAEALQAKDTELAQFKAEVEAAELERQTQALLATHEVDKRYHDLVRLGRDAKEREALAAAIGSRACFVSPTPPGFTLCGAQSPSDVRRAVGDVPLF